VLEAEKPIAFVTGASEFLRREFKFEIYNLDFDNLSNVIEIVESGIKPIIELTQIRRELDFFPKGSLVALLTADEIIDVNLNKYILNSGIFAAVIRVYGIESKSRIPLLKIIRTMIAESINSGSPFKSFSESIKWGYLGLNLWKRKIDTRKLTSRLNVFEMTIPLGYTDVFAKNFVSFVQETFSLKISPNESLLKAASLSELKGRKNRFIFIGQKGNFLRQLALRELREVKDSHLIFRGEYGGELSEIESKKKYGYEYIQTMFDSKISVCPPGNISGNSFRLMESLICGCFVAFMPNILSDPTFKPLGICGDKIGLSTWRLKLKLLREISDHEIKSAVLSNLKSLENEIAELRSRIYSITRVF
jgi:hypothetical protein